jgi:predicted Zn-dependent protease
MRAGTRSVNALLTELGGRSLVVDDLLDLSGLDLRTGALKARVDGVVMDANHPVGAMRGVQLSGNLLDLFAGIVEVSSDTDRVGHVDAAALIADGLVLGG